MKGLYNYSNKTIFGYGSNRLTPKARHATAIRYGPFARPFLSTAKRIATQAAKNAAARKIGAFLAKRFRGAKARKNFFKPGGKWNSHITKKYRSRLR
jgi:hypothetical protein